MEILKKIKKAQSLPLNTIVIAILVIIVLLVIIVFFTSKVGESGDQLNTISGCTIENPAISTLGYKKVATLKAGKDALDKCDDKYPERVSIIPTKANPDNTDQVLVCCGTKQSS